MATLEAVTVFLLNASWQLPVVAAGVWAGERWLERAPARWHHAGWFLALLLGLSLPLASLSPRLGAAAALGYAAKIPPAAAAGAPAGGGTWVEWTAGRRPLAQFPLALTISLGALFGASLLAHAARLARAFERTRALARRARADEIPSPVAELAERCRDAFGLRRVELLVSDEIPGPVALGWLRPRILMPPAFLAQASPGELAAALRHEMAHLRRRDYPLHLLAEILALPLAFHPALRLVRRRLARSREMACDEAAVASGVAPRAYARALLSLAGAMTAAPPALHTLGVSDAPTLEVRMKRMIDRRPRMGPRQARLRLTLSGLLLAALATAASAFALSAGAAGGSGLEGFVGSWAGTFEPAPGHRVPAIDLTVRSAGGTPELAVTMYKVDKHPDGTIETHREVTPALQAHMEDGQLVFRTRLANFPFKEKNGEIVEMEWKVELTGKDTAALHAGWNSKFSPARKRGEDVPPPPPPLPLHRVP